MKIIYLEWCFGRPLERAFRGPTTPLVAGGMWPPHEVGHITGNLTTAPAVDGLLVEGAEDWEELPILFVEVPTGFISTASRCREEDGADASRLSIATGVREGTGCWTAEVSGGVVTDEADTTEASTGSMEGPEG